MSKLVKSNVYRCIEYCADCPFKDDGEAIHLNPGRVDQIKHTLLNEHDSSFNCHKTVYNLDNQGNNTREQKKKMCYGAYKFLKENGVDNAQMRLALSLSIDK